MSINESNLSPVTSGQTDKVHQSNKEKRVKDLMKDAASCERSYMKSQTSELAKKQEKIQGSKVGSSSFQSTQLGYLHPFVTADLNVVV